MRYDKERLKAVERWALYVRDHSDLDWSRHQKVLIDSQIINAKNVKLTKEQVKYIKIQ
jgi:hypothetical protein